MDQHRTFAITDGSRKAIWVWLALFGPSGSGKTCSMLRVATGLQEVCGGKIAVVDTENHRAERYAPTVPGVPEPGKFMFRHLDFMPQPDAGEVRGGFDPMNYYAAAKQCVDDGARVVIIDSMSHEHTGTGGVLEQHEKAAIELAARWRSTPDKCNQSAWIPIKARRSKAIELLQRLPAHILFGFRAKEKTKPDASGKPQSLGFMAIGGEDWIFECELSGLLLPGADGVPTWKSRDVGSQMMIKTPGYLQEVIERQGQLSEDTGRVIGRWVREAPPRTATATTTPNGPPAETPGTRILQRLAAAKSTADLDQIAVDFKAELAERTIRRSEGEQIRLLAAARREALAGVVPPDLEPGAGEAVQP